MQTKFIAGLLVILSALSGCASVPMAPSNEDEKAKEFQPSPGKAALYIYRNENFGAAIPMTVDVNGRTLGQTAAKTYFKLDLTPGQYTVNSHGENVSTISIDTLSGKNLFLWQEIKMGAFMPRSQLKQVDETSGRAGVMESKLIASKVSGAEVAPTSSMLASVQEEMTSAIQQKLKSLQEMKESGLISALEYENKKAEILRSF